MYTVKWEGADLLIGEYIKMDYTDAISWLSLLAFKAKEVLDLNTQIIARPESLSNWYVKLACVGDLLKFSYHDQEVPTRGFIIESLSTGEKEGFIYLHPIYLNNSLIFGDRTFTEPARLYIERNGFILKEIKKID